MRSLLKNRSNIILVILTFIALFGAPVGAVAEPVAPDKVIQGVSEQLLKVLEIEQERLQSDPANVYRLANKVLVPHVDFVRVSGLALGKHWRRATKQQRKAFIQQFQRLLVRTYSTAMHEFASLDIRYLPLRMVEGEGKVAVRTQILRAESTAPVEVIYSMHLKEGSWMAYDVKIDGISLVTNYRRSFSREIRRAGMDGLISKLTAMNDKRAENPPANKTLDGEKVTSQ